MTLGSTSGALESSGLICSPALFSHRCGPRQNQLKPALGGPNGKQEPPQPQLCKKRQSASLLCEHPSIRPSAPSAAPSSLLETRRSWRYQRVSLHGSHHQKAAAWFPWKQPTSRGSVSEDAAAAAGGWEGGGVVVGCYGDCSNTLHKYSTRASAAPSHIPPYNYYWGCFAAAIKKLQRRHSRVADKRPPPQSRSG